MLLRIKAYQIFIVLMAPFIASLFIHSLAPFAGYAMQVLFFSWALTLGRYFGARESTLWKVLFICSYLFLLAYIIVCLNFARSGMGNRESFPPIALFAATIIVYLFYIWLCSRVIQKRLFREGALTTLKIFLGLMFFPIGVWFLQPRIAKVRMASE
jgi:hypothetical protein